MHYQNLKKEEETMAEPMEAMEIAKETTGQEQKEHPKMEEITLKFGKGCVGEPFMAKDGKEYVSILIPNSDENDHRPWATFVARSNAVHDDKFGKGMWTKLPAEGHTTIRRSIVIGEDENGKRQWDTQSTKVTNRELKGMVEFYKNRPKEKESLLGKLSEKKEEAAKNASLNPQDPKKAMEAVI